MTTLRQQAAWLLCFLAGIWLGVKSDWSSSTDDEAAVSKAKNGVTAVAGMHAASTAGSQRSTKSAVSTTPGTLTKKPDKPVKKTTLDDLRRLLAINLYDCDLRRLFHDFEALPKGLPAADLPAAAATLWSSPHRMWTIMTLIEVLNRWAESEPKAPLDWLRTLNGEDKSVQLMRENLLHVIGKAHPDLLWQEIGPTQEWMREGWIASGMIGQYFAGDLNLAQKFFDALTDPCVRDFAFSSIASELAKKDPAAAIAWARSQTQSDWSDQVIANLYGRLAEKNPDVALAALNDTGTPLTSQQRERALEGLAEHHPDRLRSFIADGGLKSATMSEVKWLANNMKKLPRDLIDLAANVPAGEVRDSFLSSVAFKLSEQGDLEGAEKALRAVHPSLERVTAMREYAKGRASKSIADTTAWLTSLPPGPDRDAAIEGFTWHADETQPQMAIEWATAIAAPQYRETAIESAFDTWHKNNAKAAEAWLNGASALSADEKARLMEKVTKN